jgi:hypothetical protein
MGDNDFAFDRITTQLTRIERTLDHLLTKERPMSILDDLRDRVAAHPNAEQSVILLVDGIAAHLDAAGTDATALATLAASLRGNRAPLAAAVIANTQPPPESTEEAGKMPEAPPPPKANLLDPAL